LPITKPMVIGLVLLLELSDELESELPHAPRATAAMQAMGIDNRRGLNIVPSLPQALPLGAA
jgi:hypothetical protein